MALPQPSDDIRVLHPDRLDRRRVPDWQELKADDRSVMLEDRRGAAQDTVLEAFNVDIQPAYTFDPLGGDVPVEGRDGHPDGSFGAVLELFAKRAGGLNQVVGAALTSPRLASPYPVGRALARAARASSSAATSAG